MPEPARKYTERAPAPQKRESSVGKYLETFLKVDQASRYGLQEVAKAARVLRNRFTEVHSGQYEDMREMLRLMQKRDYAFISEALADPNELKDALTALKIISLAKRTRRDLVDAIATDYAGTVLAKFGLDQRYNAPINLNEKAGEFFRLRGSSLKRQSRDDDGGLSTVLFEGIDQDPSKTGIPKLQQLEAMGLPACLYAYSGIMNQLATGLGSVLSNRDSFTTQHMEVAAKLHYARESEMGPHSFDKGNIIAYSIGCFMWKGVQNALIDTMLRDCPKEWDTPGKIENFMGMKRALTVGIQPLWNVGTFGEKEMYLLKPQATPEITLYSCADMFGPTSRYSRGIICGMMARDKEHELDTNFVLFKDPRDPNKVAVFIHPNALNVSAGKAAGRPITNVGAHDYMCYMASVGLVKDVETADPEGKKIGEIIRQFFSRQLDLSQTTVTAAFEAQGFKVHELDKEKYRALYENGHLDQGYLAWEAGIARQLCAEYLARGNRHPLLEPKQSEIILG